MLSEDGLSNIRGFPQEPPDPNPNPNSNPSSANKKKRSLPGNPDPDAEVVALSPKSLMATNRFICEICNKGFQRDQNLQLHRRGHNLPWKLRQRSNKDVIRKKVYVCPEKSCVHHDPSRALGDLTGIKKHYSRKHGEKKWKCEKCSKKYAVQSDWKAHSKICGTREYKCDCGTLFSRKDSFITHRAFCDALAEENARFGAVTTPNIPNFININHNSNNNPQAAAARIMPHLSPIFPPDFAAESPNNFGNATSDHGQIRPRVPLWLDSANSHHHQQLNSNAFMAGNSTGLLPQHDLLQGAATVNLFGQPSSTTPWLNNNSGQLAMSSSSSMLPRGLLKEEDEESKGINGANNNGVSETMSSLQHPSIQNLQQSPAHMSATALLQKAAQMGSTRSSCSAFNGSAFGLMSSSSNNNNSATNNSFSSQNKLFVRSSQLPNQTSTTTDSFNDLVNSQTATNINVADHHHQAAAGGQVMTRSSSSMFLGNSKSNLDQLNMANNMKQSQSNTNENEHSLTRDFLGVGSDHHHHHHGSGSFFQQELAKFASMGSAMNLSQYSAGNH
ncbi:protein indeterminate-domain 9 [Morus notabilis]|uniref:protein indeterminate-domain 9 n=1 Tax=Morus notabilis TaxID=981085 RepID=UPI000CECECA1|nr:protein indeterminate-domain 9 [Morus notabilis]